MVKVKGPLLDYAFSWENRKLYDKYGQRLRLTG